MNSNLKGVLNAQQEIKSGAVSEPVHNTNT